MQAAVRQGLARVRGKWAAGGCQGGRARPRVVALPPVGARRRRLPPPPRLTTVLTHHLKGLLTAATAGMRCAGGEGHDWGGALHRAVL